MRSSVAEPKTLLISRGPVTRQLPSNGNFIIDLSHIDGCRTVRRSVATAHKRLRTLSRSVRARNRFRVDGRGGTRPAAGPVGVMRSGCLSRSGDRLGRSLAFELFREKTL
ncbi:unnamed protein product, partial [Iphiclides podalirius]